MCGHSQCWTAMHKYAGQRAHVELAAARSAGEISASNRRSVRTARARACKAGTIIPWRRGEHDRTSVALVMRGADGRPSGLTTAGRLRVPALPAQWRYARQGLEMMLRKLVM